MSSWLPSIAYPPERVDGYWAPITSTLDWCEENYYATPYSAEIVNSLTNLVFIYLAFKGMYNCYKNGHDRIFFVTFLGYLIVGSGSFAFHSTLKYPMQLVDELGMIYTTCLMFWATFEHKRSHPIPLFLGIFCVALSVFITLYYHYLQDPTFHQNAYAILTAVVLFRSIYIMEVNIRPYYRNKVATREKEKGTSEDSTAAVSDGSIEAQRVRDERDQEIIKTMWTMIGVGLGIFLGGFGIWALDNVYCSKLRSWRHHLGLPWGLLLEGHGWWHIMTGTGAYFYIVWGIYLRHCLNERQDEFELIWPMIASLPRVERRRPVVNGHEKTNGFTKQPVTNGDTKK